MMTGEEGEKESERAWSDEERAEGRSGRMGEGEQCKNRPLMSDEGGEAVCDMHSVEVRTDLDEVKSLLDDDGRFPE